MADQVSVRLAVVGGSEFRNEIRMAGQQGAQAMGQISNASRSLAPAVQNAAFQVGDFAVQVAGGTSATRAFAQQMPQLLGSFGLFGALGGAAVAIMAALAPSLFEGSKSAAEMAKGMTDLTGSLGSVNSAVSALEAVQRAYTDAIETSGGASSAAAALVVANSAAEFEARKRVLAAEIEIARFRGAEKATELQNLETQFRREGQDAMDSDIAAYGGLRRPGMAQPTGFAARRQMGIPRPTPAFDQFLERNREVPAAISKIRAEVDLMNLSLEQAETALNTTFADISTGGGTGAGSKGGKGGGGGGKVSEAAREAKKVFDETRTSAERYAAAMANLNQLLAQGAIDQDTYNRKAAALKSEFDSSARFAEGVAAQVKSGLSGLFDSIVEGGGKAGQAIEGLGKKLASMALQESAFRLLARLLPNTFGAGGFIPLLANANGNAFAGGRVVPFAAGGVVSGPTLFPMAGGAGLMGEAGPEAIMPLTRVGGKLGVKSAGGGTFVQVINQTGQPVREERQTGPDGRELVRIVVGEDMAKGRFDGAMGRFGARPAKARRG